MEANQRDVVKGIIEKSLEQAATAAQALSQDQSIHKAIGQAAELLAEAFQAGHKAYSCGNGGSLCDAMHFAEELSGRFRGNRPPLPATAIADPGHITCPGNDYGYDFVFSRYIKAHGRPGDVLLAISTSGSSRNVINGAKEALALGMKVISLSGRPASELASQATVDICTPGGSPWADRVQELHIKVIHTLIELVEVLLFSSLKGPLLLKSDNFVPESRTPWGGTVITQKYKEVLHQPSQNKRDQPQSKVGESWEFSLDRAYPSTVDAPGDWFHRRSLAEVMENFPSDIFSQEAIKGGVSGCRILIKLLDAAEPLSLQVHPRDDDPDLRPNECGKPESWLILDAKPDAGIYLGFSRPISLTELRDKLLKGDQAKSLLYFHPVKPGEYFEIEPGVPHAIGPGVTLLEPQRVLAGREGKTFRLWDWGRLYGGSPRELHLEQGLKLIDPMTQVGPDFVARLLRKPNITSSYGLEIHRYPPNNEYQTILVRAKKGAKIQGQIKRGFAALFMLQGKAQVTGGASNSRVIYGGQPVLIPHAANPFEIECGSDGNFVFVIPSHATLELSS